MSLISPFSPSSNPASSHGGGGADRPVLSPWMDYASVTLPDSHELVLWWAQYLWMMDGNYRSALERVAAHFMTIIEFPDLEPDEESEWRDFFTNQLNYRRELLACAHDYLCYGNLFVALYLPFQRFVACEGCGLEHTLAKTEYQLDFSDQAPYLIWRRLSPCSKCGDKSPYRVFDRRSSDLSKVKLNRYSPLEIELAFNRFSQTKNIFWNIPDDERRDINNKARIHIDETPMEILQTVAAGGKLHFNSDLILHVDEPTVSGVRTRGWGIPRTIANFRSAWMQQVTSKADQAVMLDYTLGMRFISPEPTPGGTDPMVTRGMQEFVENIAGNIREHRLNPTSYHTSPYPLRYNFMGGEGATLVPPDKLKFRQQEYLNQLGVPLEYHQMSLSTQAAPMALRLFESYWQQIPAFYNQILRWIVDNLSKTFELDKTVVNMAKTTVVDDASYKAMLLQLMSGNQLSPQTALEPLGINAHEEVRKVYRHQDYVQRIQSEFDEKAQKRQEMQSFGQGVQNPSAAAVMQGQQQGGAGGAPPAGVPMGGIPLGGTPGGGNQSSLAELSEQATEMAQQLLTLPDYDRKKQLKMLREGNKELHSLVKAELAQLRQEAASQGQQMLLQPGQPQQ